MYDKSTNAYSIGWCKGLRILALIHGTELYNIALPVATAPLQKSKDIGLYICLVLGGFSLKSHKVT